MRQRHQKILVAPTEARKLTKVQGLSEQAVSVQPARPDSERRRHERQSLSVPFRLRIQDRELTGSTQEMSPGGLRLISDTPLRRGTPLALHVSFGNFCFLNLSGQIVFCQGSGGGTHVVGIKFAALREWEQEILSSGLQELKQRPTSQEESLLTMLVSKDALAQEAANLGVPTSHLPSGQARKGFKRPPKFTPHPAWILELDQHIEPYRNAILECRLVQEASVGTLSLKRMRAWMVQLYPFIETFPKWIALNIAKTQDALSRGLMIDNVRVEKRHAEQWVYMARGFGVNPAELHAVQPLPEVEALTHWLWSINTQGTLAEAVGATNYAIEGVTQGIAKLTLKGFPHYQGLDGVHLDKRAYWWMEAHARYDEVHPLQALEVMKLYTTTKELEKKVTFATRRSLEYFLMALEACYTHFQPEEVEKHLVNT